MFSYHDIAEIKDIIRDTIRDELRPILERSIPSKVSGSDPLLSRQDAAHDLGVSVQTIAKLIGEGKLRCVRINRRVLIPKSVLLAYTQSTLADGGQDASASTTTLPSQSGVDKP